MGGLLMPSGLVFLLLAVNIPTMIKYLVCSLCAARIPMIDPALHRDAGLRLGSRSVRILGYAAAACAMGVIAMGVGDDWYAYVLTGGWLMLGLIYWSLRGRRWRTDVME
jgi:APA family basic amino acid/polyamine antiporter